VADLFHRAEGPSVNSRRRKPPEKDSPKGPSPEGAAVRRACNSLHAE